MSIKRTASGNHAAVKAFRAKLASIEDGTLENWRELGRELDAQIEARKDPRRDGDSDPPIDIIDLGDLIPGPEDDP
jgi:hypothetical protein